MRIEYLERQLRKRQRKVGLEFQLRGGAGAQDLASAQDRLGVEFPLGVCRFYAAHDGLEVADPALEVFGLDRLRKTNSGIVFSVFDGAHEVAFRSGIRNAADEWDVVSAETGFCMTMTMASFWSNKVFAWIDGRREVWGEEFVAPKG